MVNISKLEEVRARIVEYSENFNYEFIVARRDQTTYDPRSDHKRLEDLLKHGCNTCGCVAGFTVCDLPPSDEWKDALQQATILLKLTWDERKFLFQGRQPKALKEEVKYLADYDYPENFSIEDCTQKEGMIEALKRIDFILDHYRNLPDDLAS